MLKIECGCGNKAYLEYMSDEKGVITLSMDIDTMGLEYDKEKGLRFICPECEKIYDIIRVQ